MTAMVERPKSDFFPAQSIVLSYFYPLALVEPIIGGKDSSMFPRASSIFEMPTGARLAERIIRDKD
jgi:hypothetical protein